MSGKVFTQAGKIEYIDYNLDNGLKVILSKDTNIPSVAINVCYHVGSKDEEPSRTGFAHLFEHLMFEGSKNVPPGDYDRLSLLAGAENNAYTTDDKTNYYIVLPGNQLELGLWLESDRMLQFATPEISLITQKEVVKEEKRQNFDNRPFGSLGIEFAPRLFKKSHYHWDTIGDMKHIDAATMDEIKTFYEKYYIPNNAVLAIAGDIDINETKELVKKYFNNIPAGNEIVRNPFDEELLSAQITDTIYDNIQLPGVFIGYRIPQENSREFFIFDLLSDILASGESSRLYKNMVYDKQIASEVNSYIDAKEYAGVFYVYAISMPGVKVGELQKEIDRIIGDIKAGNIKDSELEKVKNKTESRDIYKKQTILSVAEQLAHYKTFYNNPELINTHVLNYGNITKQEIVDAANKYLVKNNSVVLYYLPKQK